MNINIADKLIERIIATKNPSVVGLDPDINKIPRCYLNEIMTKDNGSPLKQVSDLIISYNKDIIDTLAGYIPAVKPQMAFYEMYGHQGVRAFEETAAYAHRKGLIVIGDVKRNDIGNTAQAYANGYLGTVDVPFAKVKSFEVDFLTVSPFLGSESLAPFFEVCKMNNKGVFILVKTSNKSAGEIQDSITPSGCTVSESLANLIELFAKDYVGEYGYSPVGAVVGATYPMDAKKLRNLMPKSFILVPGYGVQGAGAKDIVYSFNDDGLGAIVNSSRGILYSHMTDEQRNTCTKKEYLESVKQAAILMQKDIYNALTNHCSLMKY